MRRGDDDGPPPVEVLVVVGAERRLIGCGRCIWIQITAHAIDEALDAQSPAQLITQWRQVIFVQAHLETHGFPSAILRFQFRHRLIDFRHFGLIDHA